MSSDVGDRQEPYLRERNYKHSNVTGFLGILTAVLLLLSLIAIIFIPLLNVNGEDESTLIDFTGRKYLFGDEEIDGDDWDHMDQLNNGRWQGVVGTSLGLLIGIAIAILGFKRTDSRRSILVMSVIRSALSTLLLLPAILMMLFSSKFIGFSISVTNTGDGSYSIIPISPILIGVLGASICFLSLILVKVETTKMKSVNECSVSPLPDEFLKYIKKMNLLTYSVIIISIIMLVMVHSFPFLLIEDKEEYSDNTFYVSTSVINTFQFDSSSFEDINDGIGSLELVNILLWISLAISFISMIGIFLYRSNLSPATGHILLIIGSASALTLTAAFIFKIISVVQFITADLEYESIWYGYNYVQELGFVLVLPLAVLSVYYSIKGLRRFVKAYGSLKNCMGAITLKTMRREGNRHIRDHFPPPQSGFYDYEEYPSNR